MGQTSLSTLAGNHFFQRSVIRSGIIFIPACLLIGILSLSDCHSQSPAPLKETQVYDAVWQLFTRMHEDAANLDKAESMLQDLLIKHPGNPITHWRLSEVLYKKGEIGKDKQKQQLLYENSLAHARRSFEISNSLESRFFIGCNQSRLAEINGTSFSSIRIINEAIKQLKQTIQLNPNHQLSIVAQSILSNIYTQAPWPIQDLSKALQFAESSVRKAPNLTYASYSLSLVYAELKQYEKARIEAKRCLEITNPVFIWDAHLFDWPKARRLLSEIKGNN